MSRQSDQVEKMNTTAGKAADRLVDPSVVDIKKHTERKKSKKEKKTPKKS